MSRYTISQFNADFPDDKACLESVFQARFQDAEVCHFCNNPFRYYKVTDRTAYACAYCGHHVYPLKGTIFEKSSTPLKLWFHAIFLFGSSKHGVSAKELERQLGVTYKTAWRMATEIRRLFDEDDDTFLDGVVEADEAYMGGRRKGRRGRGAKNKTPVLGIVERGGRIMAEVAENTQASSLMPFIATHVADNATMVTDDYRSYNGLANYGFHHHTINHSAYRYVDGLVHTNTIEGFWSIVKRSIRGTHIWVSPKYLPRYINEYVWKYNRRATASGSLVSALLARALLPLQSEQ